MNSQFVIGIVPGVILWISFSVLWLSAFWKIFVKAGQPGWAALIPIYGVYILLKVIQKSGWWLLLYLVPFVNIIIHLVVCILLSKAFARSVLFGIILLFFIPIGYFILAFGKSTYVLAKIRPPTDQDPSPLNHKRLNGQQPTNHNHSQQIQTYHA